MKKVMILIETTFIIMKAKWINIKHLEESSPCHKYSVNANYYHYDNHFVLTLYGGREEGCLDAVIWRC